MERFICVTGVRRRKSKKFPSSKSDEARLFHSACRHRLGRCMVALSLANQISH